MSRNTEGVSQPAPTPTDVAAGLVFRGGRLLITQRVAGDHLGGLWEFPGGKVNPGETFEQCLQRELREELGIEVTVAERVDSLTHHYPETSVHLEFFRCQWRRHEPQALGCQAFRWVAPDELRRYQFPPADAQMLARLTANQRFWR